MSTAPSIDTLLGHEGWIRAIARGLVFDETQVDDVVQDAWITAMQKPPRDAGALRSWMATVSKNLARQHGRAEARRDRREQSAAQPEALPSTAEMVERAELRRQVVDAVLALEEPYRSTVLWRYFEGVEPKDIAERLGEPAATVRTRLKRGLDRLRERLDGAFGARHAWIVPMLVLAGAGAADAAPAPASPPAAPTIAVAGTGIAWVVPVGVASAALLGGAIAWWGGAFGAPADPGLGAPPVLASTRLADPPPLAPAAPTAVPAAQDPEPPPVAPPAAPQQTPADRRAARRAAAEAASRGPRQLITGWVRNAQGEPIARQTVHVSIESHTTYPDTRGATMMFETGEDGRFELGPLPLWPWRLWIEKGDYRYELRDVVHAMQLEPGQTDVVLVMHRLPRTRLKIVAAESGEVLPDATAGIDYERDGDWLVAYCFDTHPTITVRAPGRIPKQLTLTLPKHEEIVTREEPIALSMFTRLEGRLLAGDGTPVKYGGVLAVRADGGLVAPKLVGRLVSTGEDAHFTLELLPGRYRLYGLALGHHPRLEEVEIQTDQQIQLSLTPRDAGPGLPASTATWTSQHAGSISLPSTHVPMRPLLEAAAHAWGARIETPPDVIAAVVKRGGYLKLGGDSWHSPGNLIDLFTMFIDGQEWDDATGVLRPERAK